jgi:hypothetical protein
LNSGVQSVLVKEMFRPAERIRPARARQAAGHQRDGRSLMIKVLFIEDNDDNVYMLKYPGGSRRAARLGDRKG